MSKFVDDVLLPQEYLVSLPYVDGGRPFMPQICLTDLIHLASHSQDAENARSEADFLVARTNFVHRVLYRHSPLSIWGTNMTLPQIQLGYAELGRSAKLQLRDLGTQREVFEDLS